MGASNDDFAATYCAVYPAVVRFAEGMLRDAAHAHDIAQEAFVRLARSGVAADRARFWLFRVTRNLALNELRRRRRAERLHRWLPWLAPPATPLETAERRETETRVRCGLDQLPPQLRAPLLLREWESMSYDEIARALGVSVAKVKSDLFRARQRLREFLSRGEP